LIAEDDPAIADSVGYPPRACEAVFQAGPGAYDLLILALSATSEGTA
jgi:hypothetical protein